MIIQLYYQKKPASTMNREDAAKLTLGDLENNYVKVALFEVEKAEEEITTADFVDYMFRSPLTRFPTDIHRLSMYPGDIVVFGEKLHICCCDGWYVFELSNFKSNVDEIMEAS